MLTIEDLTRANDKGIQEVLKKLDHKVFARAMLRAGEDVRCKFFRNMSARAVELIRETMGTLDLENSDEFRDAERSLLDAARRLQADGVLIEQSAGGRARGAS